MAYQYILSEKRDRVQRITLNRPEKLNALSTELQNELIDALLTGETDDEVRVLVLKGAGRAFSSGYDITPRREEAAHRHVQTVREDIYRLLQTANRWQVLGNISKPVIAQVHGYCLAGGTDLALSCDFVICARDATFGFPPVRSMGSPPTHMWTYLVGPQWAKYALMTGNPIDGDLAEHIGLALKSVPQEKLEAEVNELATTLAKIPWDLLAVNKGIVNKALDAMGRPLLQRLAAENDAIGHLAPIVAEFNQMARERGLKAVLDWRDGPFHDYRGKGK
jgi:enoyl-CoA hydratase